VRPRKSPDADFVRLEVIPTGPKQSEAQRRGENQQKPRTHNPEHTTHTESEPSSTSAQMAVLSFDHKTYGSLSTLSEAIARFDNGIGQAVLDTEIR